LLKRSLHSIFSVVLGAAVSFLAAARASDASVPAETVPVPASAGSAGVAQTSASTPLNAVGAGDQTPKKEVADTDPPGTVRLVGMTTDIGTRYSWLAPAIPIPPFRGWHQWLKEHRVSVHCALEWKDDSGKWFYSEMRSSKWDGGKTEYRVGLGQFPGTGYVAYGVFIHPGRIPREIDAIGRPVTITLDEVVKCDYHKLDSAIRSYAAYGLRPGSPGTGGDGKTNCGLGGPAYKPAQNSNTMVNYVLRKCGVKREAPDQAVGWDTVPTFPYSTDTRYPKYDNQP